MRISEADKARFWAKVSKGDGCWEWTGSIFPADGYGQFNISGPPKKMRAHRVAYILQKGPIPKGKLICHSCDNRICMRGDHLFAWTNAENQADMVRKGRWYTPGRVEKTTGTGNGRAKINERQVAEIRRSYAGGNISARKLGQQFGISETQTFRIVNGEHWKVIQELSS